MSLMSWAEEELARLGYRADGTDDGPNKWMRENVLELLRVFSDQGHSGASAPFAVELFSRLASWKTLTPLTGDDDEWHEVGPGVFQNRRASNVFKDADGNAYNIDGIVFWEWVDDDDGKPVKSFFTNKDSRVPVTFPYEIPDGPEYRERQEPPT